LVVPRNDLIQNLLVLITGHQKISLCILQIFVDSVPEAESATHDDLVPRRNGRLGTLVVDGGLARESVPSAGLDLEDLGASPG
jgi:hypothetical protein